MDSSSPGLDGSLRESRCSPRMCFFDILQSKHIKPCCTSLSSCVESPKQKDELFCNVYLLPSPGFHRNVKRLFEFAIQNQHFLESLLQSCSFYYAHLILVPAGQRPLLSLHAYPCLPPQLLDRRFQ